MSLSLTPHPGGMDLGAVRTLLDHQSGIVSRRQLLEAGAAQQDLRRWLRTKQLTSVHKGVYVNHTGPLTWSSRAWAAVQRYWPAALVLGTAVDLAGDVIHVGVAETRSGTSSERGVQVHRLRDLEGRVQWNRSPPRQRLEDALISMTATTSRRRAVELITDACRSRRTTPARLHHELVGHANARDRAWLLSVLDDAARGVQSVLEHTYLRRVERAHGLPRSERQVRHCTTQGVIYRVVVYRGWGLVVELDGRVGHESARDRSTDLARDLEAAAGRLLTVRIGWHQAELDPCATAARLGQVLQQRGWTGQAQPCRECRPGGVVRFGVVS